MYQQRNVQRITIPKKAAEALALKEGGIVGFYEEDRKIVLKKMK
ncbi:MAG: AbrB/MazE/SpoVT family DNA-binding domain-containing protein [Thermoplasmatales archaeon]